MSVKSPEIAHEATYGQLRDALERYLPSRISLATQRRWLPRPAVVSFMAGGCEPMAAGSCSYGQLSPSRPIEPF